MKLYYANLKTGEVICFDKEKNEIMEMIKIGKEEAGEEVEDASEPLKKRGKTFELPGPRNSRLKINPPDIRKADDGTRARYTPEEKEKIMRMWKAGDRIGDIAVALERKTAAVQNYVYGLIMKGEIKKRSKGGGSGKKAYDKVGIDTGMGDGPDELE